VAPDRIAPATTGGSIPTELTSLFHRLNNQLGIILANAELLESRLTDDVQRTRAGHVVASALEAIATSQQIRRLTGVAEIPTRPGPSAE
jgi:hypothetical protein